MRPFFPITVALLVLLCPRFSRAYTLITFDVDGTLVRGSGKAADQSAHARSFSHAVGAVLGKDDGKAVQPVAEALPREQFHGSTDGLILLRLARATLGVESAESFPKLDALMESMYSYIAELSDKEVAEGITPLPGVIDTLQRLANMKDRAICGLVTGNVEGIARRKMHAVGVYQTGALSPACQSQTGLYDGTEHISFLGGFGSDYCSGNIQDADRNFLDRSEQIAIATKRCAGLLLEKEGSSSALKRVVHVGDAPADVLAAKAYAERPDCAYCIGMVAVATGSYSADQLRELAGEPVPGRWEPVVVEDGLNDPSFIEACGL